METPHSSPSTTTQTLGYAGLIPFIGLSVMSVLFHDLHQPAVLFSLLAYGATIISFLGAVHWGLAMREEPQDRLSVIWGVLPSLLAWISLVFDTTWGLMIQFFTLWLCFFVDFKRYPRFGLSDWLRMRFTLTLIAGICLTVPVLL